VSGKLKTMFWRAPLWQTPSEPLYCVGFAQVGSADGRNPMLTVFVKVRIFVPGVTSPVVGLVVLCLYSARATWVGNCAPAVVVQAVVPVPVWQANETSVTWEELVRSGVADEDGGHVRFRFSGEPGGEMIFS
jgi:hypothetical protein